MSFHRCFALLLLGSLTGSLTAQLMDANMSRFAGTHGVFIVGGQLVTKDAGYFTTAPLPRAGKPDFRNSSLLQGANVVIDAFSIGEDWIIANEVGECFAPPARWAAVLFSMTSASLGAVNSQIAYEQTLPGGVGGDLLCYEFQATGTPPLDTVYRALNSSDIFLTNGTELAGYDWFAARYSIQGIEPRKELTAYFSVTQTSSGNIPLSWGGAGAQSGTTVFKSSWNTSRPDAWSRPSVYLTADDFQTSLDVDALAVDTTHYMNHYVLFSTVASPGVEQLQFLNRGTGFVDAYHFPGGLTVASRMGLALNDDIDGLCADDPGYVNNTHTWVTHARPISPPSGWQPQGNISITVDRFPDPPGSTLFHASSASPTFSSSHDWFLYYPANSTLLGPFTRTRVSTWQGRPSFFTEPLPSPALLGQQVAFGVREGFSYFSEFVGIQEWRELEKTVTAVDRFADAESTWSNLIWTNGANRLQCIYDSSHFTRQGIAHPIVINELAWRQYHAGGPTVTWPSVNVYVGYAANDYASMSTSFVANRVVPNPSPNFTGPVTMTPVAGAQPNAPSIRVALATPFQYDPTQADLLVELEVPTGPTPATTTLISASYRVAGVTPEYRARSVRSPVVTTPPGSGTLIPDVPVVEFGYVDPPDVATTTAYGTSCYKTSRTFYERFHSGAFDLGPLQGTSVNSLLLTPSGGGYSVSAGSNNWWNPLASGLAPGLAMPDDATYPVNLQSLQPPQVFNTPLGATTQLIIYSNGFVLPWGSTYVYGEPPTAEDLVNGPPRYAVCWGDLLPDGAANQNNVYAQWDASTSTYYVTWFNVGTWSSDPNALPPGTVTAQIAFNLQNGNVEYRWQTCRLPVPSMVGWSPGGNTFDPGSSDLGSLPLATGSDNPGLQLTASPRALITNPPTTVNFTVTSNPAALAFIHIMALPFPTPQPSIELGFLGLPNCYLHINISTSASFTLLGGSSGTLPFVIPYNTSLAGFKLHHQAVGLVPGVNAFGALTSNALLMTLGLQ